MISNVDLIVGKAIRLQKILPGFEVTSYTAGRLQKSFFFLFYFCSPPFFFVNGKYVKD